VERSAWNTERSPPVARNKPYSGAALLAAILALSLGVALTACVRTPPRIDLTTVTACPEEDGPGMTGPVPCVFDGGAEVGTGYGTRWVYYSPDTCPVTTVQDHRLVTCVSRDDWTGGTGSGEGRTN
jgi:hypothetical protein